MLTAIHIRACGSRAIGMDRELTAAPMANFTLVSMLTMFGVAKVSTIFQTVECTMAPLNTVRKMELGSGPPKKAEGKRENGKIMCT